MTETLPPNTYTSNAISNAEYPLGSAESIGPDRSVAVDMSAVIAEPGEVGVSEVLGDRVATIPGRLHGPNGEEYALLRSRQTAPDGTVTDGYGVTRIVRTGPDGGEPQADMPEYITHEDNQVVRPGQPAVMKDNNGEPLFEVETRDGEVFVRGVSETDQSVAILARTYGIVDPNLEFTGSHAGSAAEVVAGPQPQDIPPVAAETAADQPAAAALETPESAATEAPAQEAISRPEDVLGMAQIELDRVDRYLADIQPLTANELSVADGISQELVRLRKELEGVPYGQPVPDQLRSRLEAFVNQADKDVRILRVHQELGDQPAFAQVPTGGLSQAQTRAVGIAASGVQDALAPFYRERDGSTLLGSTVNNLRGFVELLGRDKGAPNETLTWLNRLEGTLTGLIESRSALAANTAHAREVLDKARDVIREALQS